jgi:hypothetical protein
MKNEKCLSSDAPILANLQDIIKRKFLGQCTATSEVEEIE